MSVGWLSSRRSAYIHPNLHGKQRHYLPSLPEVSISLGIFSAGILAFGLAIKSCQSLKRKMVIGQPHRIDWEPLQRWSGFYP